MAMRALDALFASGPTAAGGAERDVNAGSTLSDMFAENRQVEATQKQGGVFILDAFLSHRPELTGFFDGGACVPTEVTESQGVFSAMYDPEKRVMKVAAELPLVSDRTAAEVCKTAQYASLMRDGPGAVPDWQFACKVVSTYVGWSYACGCLQPDEAVGNYLTSTEDEDLFAAWGTLTERERLVRLVRSLVRWEDEDTCVQTLSKYVSLFGCVTDFVMSHEAKPLVPHAYLAVEAARQRLIRSLLDGNTATVITSIQKSLAKRLKRHCASDEAMRDVLQPYLPAMGGAAYLEVLERAADDITSEDVRRLLQMEGIVGDVTRPHGGGTLSI
eukprot:TRINITY_DN8463_c0_g2_i1.p1 TRINITY_DN8463_c0_g2~~TRINITY_DN8463_c0_g2_i1.p1  ORF type:complete len:345 (+),score=80.92 TRINITY_DN8463_c0_g2_i1:47-1036(+)